jgi:hypothetical protein
VCQPGNKIFEVSSVLDYTNPLTFPPGNTQWVLQKDLLDATATFVTLEGQASPTTPIVTSNITSEAPIDPRTGLKATTAFRMQNGPVLFPPDVRVDAVLTYLNNTPSMPVGLFNGMKVGAEAVLLD